MRRKLFFNVLLLSTIIVSGQNVITLTPLHQIEYECMPGQTSYTKDLTDKWLFTDLVKNTQYRISLTSPIIFDAVVLHMNTALWEIIDHSDPYFQIWKWLSGTIHKDTIDLTVYSAYSSLVLNAEQWFRLGINIVNQQNGSFANSGVKVITSMEISGPSLNCSNPVSFELINKPEYYTSITWVIKQGTITRASGRGITASSNNLVDGKAKVIFTISFSCGLNDLTFQKEFWFGKPVPSILGPEEVECYFPEWYFIDNDSKQWGNFTWTTDFMMSILGSTTGYKARIEGLDESYGQIFCEVTNTCGSTENRLVVWINCEFFIMTPNPSDDYVELELDKNKIDLNKLAEYEIRIYNIQNILLYQTKTKNQSTNINTSKFISGIYYVHVLYEGKEYAEQLLVNH